MAETSAYDRPPGAAQATKPLPAEGATGRPVLRWVAVAVLLLLAAVVVLGALVARFARSQVLDTDRYVETVAPLASDPVLQQEVVNQVITQIDDRVDLTQLAQDTLANVREGEGPAGNNPAVAALVDRLVAGLAPVVANQLEELTRKELTHVVESDTFATAWADANRAAHTNLVAVLTGEGAGAAVSTDDGVVSVKMATVVETVKQRLIDRGFSFAERIPTVDAEFVIFQSADLAQAQDLTARLNRWATWLPWVALGLLAAAALVAPDRRRALIVIGATIVASMLLLVIGVGVGRSAYLDAVPADALSQPAAASAFDIVIAPLKVAMWAALVLGVLLAVGAFLAGPSRIARAVRAPVDRYLPQPAGGDVGTWVARYRFWLVTAVLVLGGGVLLLWSYPTAWVVIGVAVVVLALLVVIRWLAGPTQPTSDLRTT